MSPPPGAFAMPAGRRSAPGPGLGLAAACLSLFAYAAALFITPALNGEIARSFGASLVMLGQLPMVLMAGFIAGVGVAGRAADRFGKLPLVVGGDLGIAAGVLLFATSGDFPTALAANFVVGFGGGLSETSSLALVSDLYEDARRTSMANLSQAMFSFGAVTSPLVVGWMLESGVEWRAGYLCVGALCVAGALLSGVAAIRGIEAARPVRLPPSSTRRGRSFRVGALPWLAVGAALYVGAEIGQSTWLSLLLERELHAAPAVAAAGLSMLWLGLGVGRLAGGFAARRLRDLTLLRGALVLATAFEVALVLAPGATTALAAAFGLGVCFGPVFPTLVSAATSARPERSGSIMAIVVACGALGGAVFPASIGWVADQAGLRPALWICVALLAVNASIFWKGAGLAGTLGESPDGP